MSPEQASAGDLDGRSDFYSLGVVGYDRLVGEALFEGEDPMAVLYSHLNDPVPEPHLPTEDGQRIFSVVQRLMEKDPERRLQSWSAIEHALTVSVESPGPGSRRTRGGRDPGLPDRGGMKRLKRRIATLGSSTNLWDTTLVGHR